MKYLEPDWIIIKNEIVNINNYNNIYRTGHLIIFSKDTTDSPSGGHVKSSIYIKFKSIGDAEVAHSDLMGFMKRKGVPVIF